MSKAPPVFIVGAPRSGTTLLLYMLRSHPNLFLPHDESHFFIPMYRRFGLKPDLNGTDNIRGLLRQMQKLWPIFFRDFTEAGDPGLEQLAHTLEAEHPTTLAELIDSLYRHLASGTGKTRWGDKTPYYVQHLDTLNAMFPDCQVVHIIRDGRDVALSMLARRRDFDVYNFYHAARYWEQCIEQGSEAGQRLGDERYMEIRYEDLLAAPQQKLKLLCDFLGEPYTDDILAYERPERTDSKLLQSTPLVSQGLQQSNTRKWRNRMTPRQIRTFDRAAAAALSRYDYPVSTPATPLPLPVRGLYQLHNRLYKWINRRLLGRRPTARL